MFVTPAILWALPLAAIPVVIYYLMRFRSLRADWGAMYVLERALERLKKKLYLDQLLLLILRVLACVLLVLVFARPVSRAASRRVSASGVHRVLLFDASYSMLAAPEDGPSAWDQAREIAGRLVADWGRGETWSLVVAADQLRWPVRDAAFTTPEKALAVLNALGPVEQASNLPQAVETVVGGLGSDPAELYVFGDLQAATWDHVGLMQSVPANVAVFWIRAAAGDGQNVAVTSLHVAHDRVLAGHPCTVEAAVRNFGDKPVSERAVELLLDGTFVARQSVSLLPAQHSVVSFDVRFATPGSHELSARLEHDALEFDNVAAAGVQVADTLSVLVCRREGSSGKFDSAAAFLDLAAQVMARSDEDENPLFTEAPLTAVAHIGVPDDATLSAHDVVLIDGGSPVTTDGAAALARFAAAGGGLVLAGDDTVDVDEWNRVLGGADLLPAAIVGVQSRALGGEEFRTTGTGSLKLYSWLEFGELAPGAIVLSTLDDGAPFGVLRRTNPGGVLLLAAGFNGRTNNLIVNQGFFPVAIDLLSAAAAAGLHPRALTTGEPIRLRIAQPETVRGVTFRMGEREPVPLEPGATVELPGGVDTSGLGTMLILRQGTTERIHFGVQGPRVDSDLRPLAPSAQDAVREKLHCQTAGTWEELDEILQDARRGHEYQPWVLGGLLLALMGEMILQLRFV